ncbi:hypothetical protein EJ08DRAFT_713029 [Tothia fuscella]|uniref:Histidine kinase n=1 Tax=Tothia fuscella TaxID=1048955 RepID=A0A9P4NTE1_9PEZI|nr:hypothetical protein EJ08DRAFT_713029 [Tothia fuscella]
MPGEWESIGLKEFLENDLRPSFCVDITEEPGPRLCYKNKFLTTEYEFNDTILLNRSKGSAAFAIWALSPATTSLAPSFHYCGRAWVANTVRDRWRVIQASNLDPYRPKTCESTSSSSHDIAPNAAVALRNRLTEFQTLQHEWTRVEEPPCSEHIQLLLEWDWASTPYGPLECWSPLLRLMSNLIIADPEPAAMYWGPQLLNFYNEAFVTILNEKHPKSLGEPYAQTWAELYADGAVAQILDEFWRSGFEDAKTTVMAHQTYPLRNGSKLEERIFNFSLIPIIDENGHTAGIYQRLSEVTPDHLNDRRSESVRMISQLTAGEEDPEAFFTSIIRGLADNDKDFPFALLYSMGPAINDGARGFSFKEALDLGTVRLEGFIGVPLDSEGFPTINDCLLSDNDFMVAVRVVCQSGEIEIFDLEDRPDIKVNIMENPPTRGFGDEPHCAIICPIAPTTAKGVLAILVLGINPRRPWDSHYADFVRGLSRVISSSLASVLLVNEQKRLAGKAVEMEQRAMAMVHTSPVGNFLMDMEGQMLYVNERWIEVTGYKHGHHFWPKSWLEVIREEYLDIMAENWRRLTEEKRAVSFELALYKPWHSIDPTTSEQITGPSYIIAAATVQQIGNNWYISGALTDISYQKWVEGLQSQRRQEAVELKRQQENFMDMTSHEMRNPLSVCIPLPQPPTSRRSSRTAVAGSSANIEDPVEFAIESARIITLCAQHQKRIIDDVLILSKVDANLIEIHPIDVQPRVLVENVVKMFAAELVAKDVTLSLEFEPFFHEMNIDWVKLDPGRLLQVLINLVTNSIKFTAESKERKITIALGASTEPPEESRCGVRYMHQSQDQVFDDLTSKAGWGTREILYLQFQVKDTGRGMNDDEMKLLFQRFSQSSPRTHTQYGGSGLGLFIARLLTRLQGGEIGVSSSAGQGSTFAFYIKTRRSETPHGAEVNTLVPEINTPEGVADPDSPGLTPLPPRDCSDLTILIVEDNLVNQRVLQKQLRSCGFRIQIANNGQEALDAVRSSHFWRDNGEGGTPLSLILMDIEMPIMNGMEATRNIRLFQAEGKLTEHVPIVAISANARSEQIAQVKESGVDDSLSKPFRIPDLLNKIEMFLGPLEKG